MLKDAVVEYKENSVGTLDLERDRDRERERGRSKVKMIRRIQIICIYRIA